MLKIISIATAAIVFAVGGIYLATELDSDKGFEILPFPATKTSRIQLPPQEAGERRRIVRYDVDGFTPLDASVEFQNGDTGLVVYRANGTVRQFYRYYPVDPRGATGAIASAQLKAFVVLDEIGRHWISDEQFRADGSLLRSGKRVESGDYLVIGRHEDGLSVSFQTVFKDNGVLKRQETFYQNGQSKLVLDVKSVIEKEQTTFYADGSLESKLTWLGPAEAGEYFYGDGLTLKMKFARYYHSDSMWTLRWPVKVEYFNPDGSLDHRRLFTHDYMEVELVVDGVEVLQRWKMLDIALAPESRLAIGNFRLESVRLAGVNGQKTLQYVIGADGSLEEHYRESAPSGGELRVIRYIGADGTVFKVEVRDSESKLVSESTGNGEKVVIPEGVKAAIAYVPPPVMPRAPEYVGGPH